MVVGEVVALKVEIVQPSLREAQDIKVIHLSEETLQCRVLCSETLYVEMHDIKAVKNVVFVSDEISVVEGVVET